VNKTNWQHVAREIQNGLPKPLNERRCRLLPEILSEWERTDLQRHRSQESRTEIRAKVKKLETVKKSALQLMKALDNVDESGHADIVFQMVIAERGGSRTPGAVRQVEFATRIDRLSQESEFLAKLAAIAPEKYWPVTPRRPRNIPAYLVLQDAAAIYEWLTGRVAKREVDRVCGKETGPFFRFASTLWPVIFNRGAEGLPSAIKNWAAAKKQFRERSPLIINIAMRHPTWGILEP
jgi:hypothetical protein